MSVHENKKQRRYKKVRRLAALLFRLGAAACVFISMGMLGLDILVMTPLFTTALGLLVLFVTVPAAWAAIATYGRGRDLRDWRGYAYHRAIWRRFLYAAIFAAAGTAVLLVALAVLALDPRINSKGDRRDLTRLHAGITMMIGTQTRIIIAETILSGITYYARKANIL